MFDIDAEVNRFFNDDSRTEGQPEFVWIQGGVCAGKTTLRRESYSSGFVVLDAAEIFLSLSRGKYYDFPDAFLEPMNEIGHRVAFKALRERRNLVTETLPVQIDVDAISNAMEQMDYHLNLVWVDCDPEVAWQRNLDRTNDNISAAFTQAFHESWLLGAVRQLTET